MKGKPPSSFKNEKIPLPDTTLLRVVYKDKVSGEKKWNLLEKGRAVSLAKDMDLDLILVDIKGNPPVCKIDNHGHLMLEQKKKEKLLRASTKVVKEMFVKVGIDPHDLAIKLNKTKAFLNDGHQVKFSILATKKSRSQPNSLEQTALRVMEAIESLPVVVVEVKRGKKATEDDENVGVEGEELEEAEDVAQARVPIRMDFLLTPKASQLKSSE